ncbi:MAG: hypothetical protein JWM82_3261, partial [Myxococcales bacterium]|nr:hypothetical protein [Myxococcales bacterium]
RCRQRGTMSGSSGRGPLAPPGLHVGIVDVSITATYQEIGPEAAKMNVEIAREAARAQIAVAEAEARGKVEAAREKYGQPATTAMRYTTGVSVISIGVAVALCAATGWNPFVVGCTVVALVGGAAAFGRKAVNVAQRLLAKSDGGEG